MSIYSGFEDLESSTTVILKRHILSRKNVYTQKADDSAQKYGFGKYLNAEDLDEKYLKWKPTSQRTF